MLILMWLFFVILNMKLNLEIALTGAAVALIAGAASHFLLGWSLKKEILFLKKLPGALLYALKLLREIFLSNLTVVKWIYASRKPDPVIARIPRRSRAEWKTVLEANSITLTPGTVTMRLTDEQIVVHCLDRSLAEGLEGSVFEQGIDKLGGDD